LLVSARCAEADEAEYEGIVLFEDGFYEASIESTATGWSPALQRLLDSPAACAESAKSPLALYKESFSPQGIFAGRGCIRTCCAALRPSVVLAVIDFAFA
jgi:hypothetical protein